MINIRWNDAFGVGNEKIDNEHKTFVELIRSLSEAIETKREMVFIERLLNELGLYARFHFYSEETLMIESDFPDFEEHQGQHEELLDRYEKRVSEFRSSPDEEGNALIMFLFSWFADHTAGTDQALADYLESCTLRGS